MLRAVPFEKTILTSALLFSIALHVGILLIKLPYLPELLIPRQLSIRPAGIAQVHLVAEPMIPAEQTAKPASKEDSMPESNAKKTQPFHKPIDHQLTTHTPTSRSDKKNTGTASTTAAIHGFPGDQSNATVEGEIRPIYPKSALNEELTGAVQVEVTIDPKGQPSQIIVIKSSGHTILDEAFIRTIRTYYKFKPKRVQGQNVEDKILLTYTFRL